MTCDCWRDEPGGRGDVGNSRLGEWKENRYYFKRRGDKQKKNIMLSFYWWPGDNPLQGSVDVGQECLLFTVTTFKPQLVFSFLFRSPPVKNTANTKRNLSCPHLTSLKLG